MPMNILIVEDNRMLSRCYTEELRRLMPDARIDVVMSVGGYLHTAADTEFDVCIMDDTICDRQSAFCKIAPLIARRFPGTIILHNSSRSDASSVAEAEKLNGIRFARGPDGRVVSCDKQIGTILEFIRTMVVAKDEMKAMPPKRVSVAPVAEPRVTRSSVPPRA